MCRSSRLDELPSSSHLSSSTETSSSSETVLTNPCLLENKFPDCVFNSFLGHDNTAKPVLKPFPIVVDKDVRQPSASDIEAAPIVVDHAIQTPQTEIDPGTSAAQATVATNGQADSSLRNRWTSSRDRTTGAILADNVSVSHEPEAQTGLLFDQATRPTKPLPRRSARNRPSIIHSQTSPEAANSVSVGRRALKYPIQKILAGISRTLYDKKKKQWKKWPKTNEPGNEKEVVKYLNGVVDAARHFAARAKKSKSPMETEAAGKDWMFYAKSANMPLESSGAKQKLVITVIPREHMGSKGPSSWADDRAIGELKRNSTFSLSKVSRALSEYARLCFSHQRTRRFVLGFSLLDTKMRLWQFDRSGVLNSREFDVHENPLDFLRVILGLTTADDYYLGLDPSFTHEDNKDWVVLNDKRYEIVDTIYLDSAIRSRGTVALVVKDDDGQYHVMKDQWVDRSWKGKEIEMLEELKKKKVKKAAGIIDYQIVHFKVGDKVVRDSTENDRNSKELQESIEEEGVEIRDHYRLLISPYGDKLENFRSLRELVSVFKDYVEVIRDLYNAGILHRDISPGNLILVGDEGESLRRGYVIDFDCAILVSRVESMKAGRAGTLPFMATDIMINKDSTHKYYHDLESLFYVLLWICITQDGPKSKSRPASEFNLNYSPLSCWCAARVDYDYLMRQVGISKARMMFAKHFRWRILSYLPAYFRPLENLLLFLRRILFQDPNTDDIESLPEDQKAISDRRNISGVFSMLISELEATLEGLPDEGQPSVACDKGITGQSGVNARAGCNVDPGVDFVETKIPDLIELRPPELLPAELRKTEVERERSHGTSGLLRATITSSENKSIRSRGMKRSHDRDQEQIAAAMPKRAKVSTNDG